MTLNQPASVDQMTPPRHTALGAAVLFLSCLLLAGCGPQDQGSGNGVVSGDPGAANQPQGGPVVDETNVAKVKVLADGKILLDEKQVTIEELKAALAKLKEKNGVVWYYRENPQGEPSPQTGDVIESVMEALVEVKLPIKLSTKPDFSDSLGPGGS